MQFQSFHTPPANIGKQWVFLPNGITQYIGEPWKKPKWASMVNMLIIQPGAGGGGGDSRASNGNGSGGGGGASGTISRLLIPAICIPDSLYIFVPPGGQGGAAETTGTSGLITTINTGRTDAPPNWLLYSSGGNATGGTGGTAGGAAAGGAAASGAAIQPFAIFGHHFTTNGIAGGNAGTNTGGAGVTITAWASNPLSPGAGGGSSGTTGPGTDFAGGDQIATALTNFGAEGYFPIAGSEKIATGGAANGGHGSAGYKALSPMLNTGGAGGGSNNDGTGGDGGNGGYGCGGGGGGAGTTGGRGGNGGEGLVIITAW